MKLPPPKHKERFYQGVILMLVGLLLFVSVSRFSTNKAKSGTPPPAYDVDEEEYSWSVTEVAKGLEVPSDIAFTPEGQMLVSERPGRVDLVSPDGHIQLLYTIPNIASTGESGLTGIALHPNFAKNRFIYLYYTYRESGELLNRVSRFTFTNNQFTNEKPIIDSMPGGSIHNGGKMRFGPDGKLWVLAGDASYPDHAQDLSSTGGKVLRVNDDGTIPSDNPYPKSLVYSLGHRNPEGLAWHPLSEELFVTEHGETAHDEINLIKPKSNYGWPEVKKCTSPDPKYSSPILCSGEDTWAPSGAAFLGTQLWRFRYSMFFAGLRGQFLKRIAIVDDKVTEQETIIGPEYGRLRAVTPGPDGKSLYVSTSNRDGRGKPGSEDDKILKVVPVLK